MYNDDFIRMFEILSLVHFLIFDLDQKVANEILKRMSSKLPSRNDSHGQIHLEIKS